MAGHSRFTSTFPAAIRRLCGCAVRATSGEGTPIVVTADRSDASPRRKIASWIYPEASACSASIKILRGCHGFGM